MSEKNLVLSKGSRRSHKAKLPMNVILNVVEKIDRIEVKLDKALYNRMLAFENIGLVSMRVGKRRLKLGIDQGPYIYVPREECYQLIYTWVWLDKLSKDPMEELDDITNYLRSSEKDLTMYLILFLISQIDHSIEEVKLDKELYHKIRAFHDIGMVSMRVGEHTLELDIGCGPHVCISRQECHQLIYSWVWVHTLDNRYEEAD